MIVCKAEKLLFFSLVIFQMYFEHSVIIQNAMLRYVKDSFYNALPRLQLHKGFCHLTRCCIATNYHFKLGPRDAWDETYVLDVTSASKHP